MPARPAERKIIKKKYSLKRLGALAMSLIMCFALAVSASAVSAYDYTQTASLDADVPETAPHTLDFIQSAIVTNDNGTSTVTVVFKNPASVSVQPSGSPVAFTSTGRINNVVLSDVEENSDYTYVSYTESTGTLILTCAASLSAEEFAPKLDFTMHVTDENGDVVRHADVSAWLYLV